MNMGKIVMLDDLKVILNAIKAVVKSKEDKHNKTTVIHDSPADIKYPTEKAVVNYTEANYQKALIAGENIVIDDNVISAEIDVEQPWESGKGLYSAQTVIDDPSWGKNEAKGDGSVAEGVSTKAHTFASHTEGYQTFTIKDNVFDAWYAHAEGYKTTAGGLASHVEGDNTVANNTAEHAEGRYNKSNMGGTDATNTLHSVGIGSASMVTPGGDRKNAFEIMQNGDAYLYGVGNYNGQNIETAGTLKEVIDDKESKGYLTIGGTQYQLMLTDEDPGEGTLGKIIIVTE